MVSTNLRNLPSNDALCSVLSCVHINRIGGVWHISYTVQSRYTFGIWGSMVPILLRVGVTCGRSNHFSKALSINQASN